MAPLAFAVFSMRDWPAARIRHFRVLLLGVLATSVALDLFIGGGRWHRFPFLLFPIVDASAALVLTLLRSKPALRIAAAIATAGAITIVALSNVISGVRAVHIEAELE